MQRGARVDEFAAAALGDTEKLRNLVVDAPTLAKATNRHETTPLHWAARNGQLESARLLLESGADINAVDAIGCPPLWYAAYWGQNAEMTHYLCEQGADVCIRNIWDNDITAYDCGYGCAAIIRRHRKPGSSNP